MGKVGKERVKVGEKDDYFEIYFDINVNVEGEFTTTLRESDVKIIESYGVQLETNGRSNGRPGFFKAWTKKELLADINDVVQQCYHRTLKEEKIVLQYCLDSVCSFGFTKDGVIIPNLGWHDDGSPDTDTGWQDGVSSSSATWPKPAGIQFYVKPSFKRTWVYPKGKTKIDYEPLSPFGGSDVKDDSRYYLRWLEGLTALKPANSTLREIDYTEERAKFFVDFYKGICKLAMTVKQFEEPQALIDLAESGRYLSTAMSDKEPELTTIKI